MSSPSSPDSFNNIPFDISAMPLWVDPAEATSKELHQYYNVWSTIYDKASNGAIVCQPTERLHAELPGPATPLIGPGNSDGLNSVKVWRLSDIDPAVRIQLSLFNKENDNSYTRLDHSMLLRASGLATYEIAHAKAIKQDPMSSPMTLGRRVLDSRTPSSEDLMLFDDALRQLTSPDNLVQKKQRLATRLGSWLFNRHA